MLWNYSKDELLDMNMQWYWTKNDLTKDNIDEFICKYIRQYVIKNNK
jgi:hypothetical protein